MAPTWTPLVIYAPGASLFYNEAGAVIALELFGQRINLPAPCVAEDGTFDGDEALVLDTNDYEGAQFASAEEIAAALGCSVKIVLERALRESWPLRRSQ